MISSHLFLFYLGLGYTYVAAKGLDSVVVGRATYQEFCEGSSSPHKYLLSLFVTFYSIIWTQGQYVNMNILNR